MRARNIKPGMFANELLGQADPAFTLVFQGLWCAADRDGRLEDRPARLRAVLLPYRREFDMEAALCWLQQNGFIDRYAVDGVAIIQVIKFAMHQRPHHNEVPSVLPAKVDSAAHQGNKPAQPTNDQGENGFALIPDPLLSDPGYLNPDTGLRIPDSPLTVLAPEVEVEEVDADKYWKEIKQAWPSGNARNDWSTAKKHAVKLVAECMTTWELLYRNACAYADYCHISQRKPADPRNYFSAVDEPWRNPWKIEVISSPALLDAAEPRLNS